MIEPRESNDSSDEDDTSAFFEGTLPSPWEYDQPDVNQSYLDEYR